MMIADIIRKTVVIVVAFLFISGLESRAQTFKKLEVSSLPELTDQLNDQDLIRCLNNCITYFNRLDPNKWHPYTVDNRPVSIPDMVSSLQAFLELYTTAGTINAFRQQLMDQFDVYAFVNSSMESKIRITTYYSPTIRASYARTAVYKYPVYGIPDDLIIFNKKDFVGRMDGSRIECKLTGNKLFPYDTGKKIILDMQEDRWIWTGGKVAGRIENEKLVPYYTRKEIDCDKVLDKNQSATAVVWVPSLVELMNIQIQGSATLVFEDGSREVIFAMYTNSLPFKNYMEAISKIKGLPNERKVINEYLENNPSEAPLLLSENPRYVFFKIRDRQNLSKDINDIENMKPYRSIAVDTRYIPLGSVGILSGVKKVSNGSGGETYAESTFFVTSQDIGGAVKGTHIDFFSGTDLTVTINDKAGEFYLLLLKKR
jgi:membrane-bound lytic murein transglycosylase A